MDVGGSQVDRKKTWRRYCCVSVCKAKCVNRKSENNGKSEGVHFHSFPSENSGYWVMRTNELGTVEKVTTRQAWEMSLKMGSMYGRTVKPGMKVCSQHFTKDDYLAKGLCKLQPKLKKDAVPSQNLPTTKSEDITFDERSSKGPAKKRNKLVEIVYITIPSVDDATIEESPDKFDQNHKLDDTSIIGDQLNESEWNAVDGLLCFNTHRTTERMLYPVLDPSESEDIAVNCSQCSYRTSSVFQLDYHVQRQHGNVYAAGLFRADVEPEQFSSICGEYKSWNRLDIYEHYEHARDSTNNENKSLVRKISEGYRCYYCRYRSDSSLSLVKHHVSCKNRPPRVNSVRNIESPDHMLTHATNQINGLQCTFCSYQAKVKSSLRQHMLKHAPNEAIDWFHCDRCSYRAKRRCNLREHLLLKHATNEEINWFHCNFCSHRAKRKSSLKNHVLHMHAADEEISWHRCAICSYRGKQKSDLKRHMMQHAADREIAWFRCKRCPYRAKQKGTLNAHMNSRHATNEETLWFDCTRCSYRAKRKSTLNTHMLQHATSEEITWFQCNQCTYVAKQKSHLNVHMLRHAANKNDSWLPCHHCSFRAKLKSDLHTHMRRQHATNLNIDSLHCSQ